MNARRLAVVSAGLGQPSATRMLADRLAEATGAALAAQGIDVEVDVVELRDLAHELTNNLLTGFAGEELQSALDQVAASDGLVAVSPIFSASYSGLFKTFFDVMEPDALRGKPTVIAATAGTPRHSLALEHSLRPLFAYLRALVVPTAVFAATEDWGSGQDVTHGGLVERIDRAAQELADLIVGRAPASPPDPYKSIVPFEQLLAGD